MTAGVSATRWLPSGDQSAIALDCPKYACPADTPRTPPAANRKLTIPHSRRLGSSGLVCWSLSGEKLWTFTAPEGLDPIADCYSLNVTRDEAWACYYTDFPVVRVSSEWEIEAWSGGPSGAHTLAVADGSVALIGGYRGLHDRLVRCALGSDSTVQSETTWQLQLPGGQDLPSNALLFARGGIVAAIVNGAWYQINIADLSN